MVASGNRYSPFYFILFYFFGNLVVFIFSNIFHWHRFDNLRVPRQNLLNSLCDVLPDGRYVSAIEDPDQVRTSRIIPW